MNHERHDIKTIFVGKPEGSGPIIRPIKSLKIISNKYNVWV